MTAVVPSASAELDPVPITINRSDCLTLLSGLPTNSVDVIATDPAYSGMNRHLSFGHGRIVGAYGKPSNHRWFEEFDDDVLLYDRFLAECLRVLQPLGHLWMMFDPYSFLSLAGTVSQVLSIEQLVVWDKVTIGMGHYYRRRFELILHARPLCSLPPSSARFQTWPIRRIRRAQYPTQKPVSLFTRMLDECDSPGVLCDPFCGSGSSAIAALSRGWSFVGGDISADAVQLARHRCAQWLADGRDPLEP